MPRFVVTLYVEVEAKDEHDAGLAQDALCETLESDDAVRAVKKGNVVGGELYPDEEEVKP